MSEDTPRKPSSRPTIRMYTTLATAALAAFLGGVFLMTVIQPPAQRFEACRGSLMSAGSIGGPFTLVSETGETVTDRDVIAGPTLIYFGYTFCPDVCPLDVDRNAAALEILDQKGHEVTPVFISVDPARDTPAHLAEFTDYFHPRMIGLTGTLAQVDAVSRAYRAYYRRHDGEDNEFYLVDHSTFSYLMFPDHGFVEVFGRDLSPQVLAERIECFVNAA